MGYGSKSKEQRHRGKNSQRGEVLGLEGQMGNGIVYKKGIKKRWGVINLFQFRKQSHCGHGGMVDFNVKQTKQRYTHP
jgi:cation transport regulator ChaC